MSKATNRQKNADMAAHMKKHGPRAPKKWHGVGSDVSAKAKNMGTAWKGRSSSTWDRGMMGGILAARCGYGTHNIPDELL